MWRVAVPACLASHTFAAVLKVLNSAMFLNGFFFGSLFVLKIFPCLYSTPFSPAATCVSNSDTCCVSSPPITVLMGYLSAFSLDHLFPFCSYSPSCCLSFQPALESCNSLLYYFTSSLFSPCCINCPWILACTFRPEGHLK